VPGPELAGAGRTGPDLGQIIADEQGKARALSAELQQQAEQQGKIAVREHLRTPQPKKAPPKGTARSRIKEVTKAVKTEAGAPGPKREATGTAQSRLKLVKQNPTADAEMRARVQRGASKETLANRGKEIQNIRAGRTSEATLRADIRQLQLANPDADMHDLLQAAIDVARARKGR
jgi:hypothetical protein